MGAKLAEPYPPSCDYEKSEATHSRKINFPLMQGNYSMLISVSLSYGTYILLEYAYVDKF